MLDLHEMSSEILPRFVKIFTVVVVVTIGLFGSLVWYTWDTFRYLETTQKHYFRLTELNSSIVYFDEVLTMSASMAAATGEQKWEARYRGFETKLDAVIKETMRLGQEFSLQDVADRTDTANLKLVDMENQAFDLVRKGQTKKAAAILSSAEYGIQKKVYLSSVAQITETIRENLEKDIAEYRRRGYLALGFILIVTPCLVFGWILVARLIRQYNASRKRADEALRGSEERYRRIVETSLEGIWITNEEHRTTFVNKRMADMLGYVPEETLGRKVDSFMFAEDLEDHVSKLGARQRGVGEVFERRFRRKDGTTIWHIVSASPLFDGQGRYIGSFAMFTDITERKRMEEELKEREQRFRELSMIDELTQLYNARHFYVQLKNEMERSIRYGQPLTLLLLDLDNFKAFNDSYGHVEGDQVLLRLGQVVKRCLRETDSAYRYGGEEFTVILPMTTSKDGTLIAARIRTEFKEEHFCPVPSQDVHVTVSIGIAQYKPKEDMKVFVHRVDSLMYQGKRNGKDRVCSEPWFHAQFKR